MDKYKLIETLQELDTHLTMVTDVILVGGAAMILHFGARRATRDVDVLLLRGDSAEFKRAVHAVALERDLPEDWINDAVKGFADILPPDFYQRLTPLDLPLQHLRLYALGRPEQAAMKIVALREQDLEDLELLLPPMTASERQVLTRIAEQVNTVRPDWAQRISYFLQEQGWAID